MYKNYAQKSIKTMHNTNLNGILFWPLTTWISVSELFIRSKKNSLVQINHKVLHIFQFCEEPWREYNSWTIPMVLVRIDSSAIENTLITTIYTPFHFMVFSWKSVMLIWKAQAHWSCIYNNFTSPAPILLDFIFGPVSNS